MKAAILAGGMGTRLQEFTTLVPKPMVEIGARPILWHIMKGYAQSGVRDFCVALGYKGHIIKRFFVDYPQFSSDLRVDIGSGEVSLTSNKRENWVVELADTGEGAQTGARLARLKSYLSGETFFLTYGDGVSDVDFHALLEFHRRSGRIATLTAVHPPARFGALDLQGHAVTRFTEKPQDGVGWVSGGFFVCEPKIFDYVDDRDQCVLEHEPLRRLAQDGQLAAFRHEGFWHSMDTVRDVETLNELWRSGRSPWKTWAE
ncbi:MAG: glucose-1-phosphate cytidylyltransferase [Alphaproteobacteria bacterium]|nr:glucose-1-phosphate cytidylyltransferase [Alphaproteobacteria bacterium]